MEVESKIKRYLYSNYEYKIRSGGRKINFIQILSLVSIW